MEVSNPITTNPSVGNGAKTSSDASSKPLALDRISGSILVVDDDEYMCEFVETTLRRRDLDVVWRTSAQEALELVGERDFDAILTDLSMPNMGGLELIERILGMRPDTPVIVVTGHGSME